MIYLDTETFSATPIRDGTFVYVANCEVLMLAYAIDDGPVTVWDVTTGVKAPGDLEYALLDTYEPLMAHNVMFDANVLKYALKLDIPLTRWHDSMVQALAHSLPGALEKTGEIMGVPEDEAKTKEGRQLVHLFTKPQPAGRKVQRATRHTHPAEWQKFKDYCAMDVVAMRAISKKLPNWNYQGAELALWRLDQTINSRGIAVDLDFARAAIDAAEKAKAKHAKRTQVLTNGDVERATQRDKLLAHILMEYGVDLPDLQASTLERRVNDPELPIELRELLDIRMQASMGSSSKYKALLKAVSADGRLRGLLQFNGANRTGRWAGRTVQPQNLFRAPPYIADDWEYSVDAIKSGAADLLFANVMEATAATVRGALVAPKGKKLVVSDLANIEGRDAAWLAGENWKLKAFAEFDAGRGSDLYKVEYSRAFRIDPESVTKEQRAIGKVMSLMLQYAGGVGAFITGAAAYSIDLGSMATVAIESIPDDVLFEAEGFYEWTVKERRSTFGLDKQVFTVCDSLKRLWRAAHPAITSYWSELEDTFRRAIEQPGNTFQCRRVKMRRDGAWLRIVLPSGRALCYPQPQVDEKGALSYAGVDQYTRRWQRIKTYSGKIFENMCQAVARDFMAASMPAAEAAGYEIVLTIHDELVCETPDSPEFTAERLSQILSTVPPWAEGMPLAAGGWEGLRYRKE